MCLSCQKHHDGKGSVEEKWDKKQGKSLRVQLCNRSSKMPNSSNMAKYQNYIYSRAANQIEMTSYATAPWWRESRECRTVPGPTAAFPRWSRSCRQEEHPDLGNFAKSCPKQTGSTVLNTARQILTFVGTEILWRVQWGLVSADSCNEPPSDDVSFDIYIYVATCAAVFRIYILYLAWRADILTYLYVCRKTWQFKSPKFYCWLNFAHNLTFIFTFWQNIQQKKYSEEWSFYVMPPSSTVNMNNWLGELMKARNQVEQGHQEGLLHQGLKQHLAWLKGEEEKIKWRLCWMTNDKQAAFCSSSWVPTTQMLSNVPIKLQSPHICKVSPPPP